MATYKPQRKIGSTLVDVKIPASSIDGLPDISGKMDKSGGTFTGAVSSSYGEIKSFHCSHKGYTNGATWYFPVCKLPIDNSGNYASAIFNGRIGGWTKDNIAQFSALGWQRGNYDGNGGKIIGWINPANTPSSAFNIADLVLYKQSDLSAIVYVKCIGYYTFDFNVDLFQNTCVKSWDGNYTTTPSGTLVSAATFSTNAKNIKSYNYNDLTNKPTIPTDTGDLTNGKGFIDKSVNNLTNYYLKTEVDSKIAAIPNVKYVISNPLPTPSASLEFNTSKTIYLKGDGVESGNDYSEYICVYSAVTGYGWEKIGYIGADFSSVLFRDGSHSLTGSMKMNDGVHLQTEDGVNIIGTTSTGYIEIGQQNNTLLLNSNVSCSYTRNLWTIPNAHFIGEGTEETYFTGKVPYYRSVVDGSVVKDYFVRTSELPTKTSDLTNDSGFLTSHQDISGKLTGTKYHTNNPNVFIGYQSENNANVIAIPAFKDNTNDKGLCFTYFNIATNSAVAPSNAVKNGFYYVTSSTSGLSGADANPFLSLHTSNNDFRILTTAYSDSWLQQIATDFRCDKVYVRRRENGTWIDWKELGGSTITSVNGLSGGTITSALTVSGNVTGQYVQGTWLKTTSATDTASWTDVFVNSDGWLYKRSKASFKSDLGVPTFSYDATTMTLTITP